MSFELFCMALIALTFGLIVMMNGYKVFLILLPIFGFIFGFVLGAQTLQALFGIGFLATVTSWAVGFVVGAVFAVLSYLFWIVAVALWSFGIGYGLGVGLMGLFGLSSGILPWLVGVVAGVALAAVVIIFNLQKWIIMLGTAALGSATVIGTFLMMFGVIRPIQFSAGGVKDVMANSPFWLIAFLVLFVVGALAQYRTTQNYMLEVPADRW
jgi:hypothetical protein